MNPASSWVKLHTCQAIFPPNLSSSFFESLKVVPEGGGGVELPRTFEKHWNVTFTQTHVPKRHLDTPAVRLRLRPCSVQPLSINPGSSSEIKDLPRQSSQPIVTLLMNPLTWLARLQSARCWLKSKDTKGQRQNHLGSLLGCQNGVPVRDNTVGADNLPLIKRRRRKRRRVCRPQGECREGEDVRGRKCRRRRFGSLPPSIVTVVRWGFKSEIWFHRQVRKTFSVVSPRGNSEGRTFSVDAIALEDDLIFVDVKAALDDINLTILSSFIFFNSNNNGGSMF